jgi:AmmeMemoRadiSam system protein B
VIREAAVAGSFYPSHPQQLEGEVRRCVAATPRASHTVEQPTAPAEALPAAAARLRALGCIVPHAGYMYSGAVAGAVYARLDLPRRFLVLCPRHYPQGAPLAILSEGAWRTPLGDAPVDSTLADALTRACPLLREDELAHQREHAIEVQLPFLQLLRPEFQFVPIALGTDRFQAFEDLGRAVARVVAAQKEPVLLVASSDMNHFESDTITRQKDSRAIERILALDPRGLYDVVRRENISMCGYGPAVTMLVAAKELGATRAELVCYATSAEASGDYDRVVGYAGIVVT